MLMNSSVQKATETQISVTQHICCLLSASLKTAATTIPENSIQTDDFTKFLSSSSS